MNILSDRSHTSLGVFGVYTVGVVASFLYLFNKQGNESLATHEKNQKTGCSSSYGNGFDAYWDGGMRSLLTIIVDTLSWPGKLIAWVAYLSQKANRSIEPSPL